MFIKNLHCLLLAAGQASRFGRPKQLAAVNDAGESLIQHALNSLPIEIPITLVLGAHHQVIEESLLRHQELAEFVVINPKWQDGLSSSIAYGVQTLNEDVDAVLITLADQVALGVDDYRKLIDSWKKQPDIIACSSYSGQRGVPAIFPRKYFSQLLALTGDSGAKALIRQNSEAQSVLLHNAAIDIDTQEQLEKFKQSQIT